MRTHKDIVLARGISQLHADLVAKGIPMSPSTTKQWHDRNAIPASYWLHIADLGLATLEELAITSTRQPVTRPPKPLKAKRKTPAQGVAA